MSKNNKKVIILIVLIIIILIILLSLFIKGLSNNKNNNVTTTTSTTKKVKKDYKLEDSINKVTVTFNDEKFIDGNKLSVKKIENVNIQDAILIYDIELLDSNNNVVKVDNTSLLISIPYNNTENYTDFKVLYLDGNNQAKETLNANYLNGNVVFRVTHLSRYAIVATKKEDATTTTTKKTTTKTQAQNSSNTNSSNNTNNNSNSSVSNSNTTKATTKSTTTKTTTKATTKSTTTSTTTTTTKKTKSYTYSWGSEKDGAGQQYLYIVDQDGNKVNGTVTVTYVDANYSETVNVGVNGVLLIKSIVSISNVKAN